MMVRNLLANCGMDMGFVKDRTWHVHSLKEVDLSEEAHLTTCAVYAQHPQAVIILTAKYYPNAADISRQTTRQPCEPPGSLCFL